MNLAIITPTRRRWNWLAQQAKRIAPQLKPDDRWIIVIDQDNAPPRFVEQMNELIGIDRLVWCLLCYHRPDPPVARVNYAHNVGAALAPPGYAIAEIDDHDLIEPDALDAIREAFEGGADYVFGWYKQQAIFDGPQGQRYCEVWPHVKSTYEPGGFSRNDIGSNGIALRAIRRELWDRLGGWSLDVWPCADKDFAVRAETAGASIACIQRFLCTVTVEGDSLSANYRGANPLDQEAQA